jgi:MFS family permease
MALFDALKPDSLLRNPEFRTFLIANSFFHFCSSSLTIMLAFHIYSLRGNPLDIAALGFVQVLPALTMALHGGDVADRKARRLIVVMTVGGIGALAACLALLSMFDLVTVWVLLLAGFASASMRAYENPANVGLEAQVIPTAQILQGVPMVSTASRIADMCGPVVMGFIWAYGGPSLTYGVMAAVLVAAAMMFHFRIRYKPAPEGKSSLPPLVRIKEGLQFVLRSQVLLGSMMLDLFAVFFAGAAALLPIFATDILDAGPQGFGMMRSAMAAGALVSAVFAIRYMPAASAGLALHLIVGGFGLSMVVFALSTNLYLSLMMLFLAGVCDGMSMVIRHAILRLASPDHMRGRIAAVRMVFVASSNELGAVQSGTMASLLGPVRAVVAGGLLTVIVVGVVAHRMPALRQLNLLDYGSNARPKAAAE